jgi:uncharacterized protein (DUF2236 family)
MLLYPVVVGTTRKRAVFTPIVVPVVCVVPEWVQPHHHGVGGAPKESRDMHFQDVARLRRLLAAEQAGEPIDPADVAAGLAALDRELEIKRAASARSKQNLERATGHEWRGPWPSDLERT